MTLLGGHIRPGDVHSPQPEHGSGPALEIDDPAFASARVVSVRQTRWGSSRHGYIARDVMTRQGSLPRAALVPPGADLPFGSVDGALLCLFPALLCFAARWVLSGLEVGRWRAEPPSSMTRWTLGHRCHRGRASLPQRMKRCIKLVDEVGIGTVRDPVEPYMYVLMKKKKKGKVDSRSTAAIKVRSRTKRWKASSAAIRVRSRGRV